MPKLRVLILTDSRGANLHNFIDDLESNSTVRQRCTCSVKVYRGADFERIKCKLESILRKENFDLTIILTGICNFTTKTTERDLQLLHYVSQQDRITLIKDVISRLDRKYSETIHIGRIPPACLIKYFESKNPGKEVPSYLAQQQADLIKDIEEVNKHITDINKARNQQSLDLDDKVFKKSVKTSKKGKQRKNPKKTISLDSNLLHDGVHPTRNLEIKWFNRLITVISAWANNKQVSDTSFSSQESEVELQDHRRTYKSRKRRRSDKH